MSIVLQWLRSRRATLLAALVLPLAAQAAGLTVSAAASLGDALRELAPLYEAARPATTLRLNLGASGALLRQIAQGAPVDVLISADEETMDQALAQGLVRDGERRRIATNRLVVVVPAAATAAPRTLADLTQPAIRRVAIGLPTTTPAGRYAEQALAAVGLGPALQAKLITAQSVRQALDYVVRGEVDAGFVYRTDVAVQRDKVRVAFEVPTPTPIRYLAAPVAASAQATLANAFVAFLASPPAQAVLARHGFGAP